MPLLSSYQEQVFKSLKKHDFPNRIAKMKGRCHDVLIGEWANWWLSRDIDGMVFNPARASREGSVNYIADLQFLERFAGSEYYEVKGVQEVENNEDKIFEKIRSLASYEKYSKKGMKVYPDLEFAILNYKIDLPNDKLGEGIYDKIIAISSSSNLLWVVCELGKTLGASDNPDYAIHMPNHVRGAEWFWYYRNFSSLLFYAVKIGKQIDNIVVPGFDSKAK
jgi:hypothetical protein